MEDNKVQIEDTISQEDDNSSWDISYCQKIRVYPSKKQEKIISHWSFFTQLFRNQAVAFLKERHNARITWFESNPSSITIIEKKVKSNTKLKKIKAKNSKTFNKTIIKSFKKYDYTALPKELSISQDIPQLSYNLTARLSKVLSDIKTNWGITGTKKQLAEQYYILKNNLTSDEFLEIPDLYLLTLPRVFLDQIILDLKKTQSKALKDRKKHNKSKNEGLVLSKPAGFAEFKKIKEYFSVRTQTSPGRQAKYEEYWKGGFLYYPGLGKLVFKDKNGLPLLPSKMLTLKKEPTGHYYVTFVVNNDSRKTATATPNNIDKSLLNPFTNEVWDKLPLEESAGCNDSNNNDNDDGNSDIKPVIGAGDAGLSSIITQKDGTKIKNNRYHRQYDRKKINLQKQLSRRKKSSGKYKRTQIKLARTHNREVNQQNFEYRKIAQTIASNNAIFCIEDLFIKGLMQNRKLSRSIQDASLFKFKEILRWEMKKRGHLLIECGRFDASSKTCFTCKHKNKELKLEERFWTCSICGTTNDRDINAAQNIEIFAIEKFLAKLYEETIETIDSDGEITVSTRVNLGKPISENGIANLVGYRLNPMLGDWIVRGGLASILDDKVKMQNANSASLTSVSQTCEACILSN